MIVIWLVTTISFLIISRIPFLGIDIDSLGKAAISAAVFGILNAVMRINRIEASYGIDIILQFHRYTSIVAVAFILSHPLILFAVQPETIQLLNFAEAPWRARYAVLSTLALIALIATTIWRQQLKIPYEPFLVPRFNLGTRSGRFYLP
jgi:predicted ferric reductase